MIVVERGNFFNSLSMWVEILIPLSPPYHKADRLHRTSRPSFNAAAAAAAQFYLNLCSIDEVIKFMVVESVPQDHQPKLFSC